MVFAGPLAANPEPNRPERSISWLKQFCLFNIQMSCWVFLLLIICLFSFWFDFNFNLAKIFVVILSSELLERASE